MNFKTLSPDTVDGLVLQAPKRPQRGIKRPRLNNLDCYTPPGDAQASRRITGSHLDPDSSEMETAAMYFTEGLTAAMNGTHSGVRSLIGPARYSDRILEKYCRRLLKGAMGPASEFIKEPISPQLVPYLLGGMTWRSVEERCYRALYLLDFEAEPAGVPLLGDSVGLVGFGAHIRHDHTEYRISYDLDNTEIRSDAVNYKVHNHLSFRQDFLLNLPRNNSYAALLIRNGAYDDVLRRQIAGWRPEIMREAERLLDPEGGEMPTRAAGKRAPVKLEEFNFTRSVKLVFEQDWDQLDLVCGDQGTALQDAEVLMARMIIQRLGYAPQMTAECLVGMSLLTGISVVNWVQFAVKDRERRGETFISQATVERVIELCEYQAGYTDDTDQQLRSALYALADSVRFSVKRKWARRLASKINRLWSTNGLYYEHGKGDDEPTFSVRPFQPNNGDRD